MSASISAAVLDLQVASYAYVAVLFVTLYDYCLCLSREIEVVWRNKQVSSADLLYVILRYGGLICAIALTVNNINSQMSDMVCYVTWVISEITYIIPISVLQCVMIMRLYALYNGNKKVLCFVITFFLVELLVNVVVLAIEYHKAISTQVNMLGFHTCETESYSLPVWVLLINNIIPLVLQVTILVLTLWRFVAYLKETQQQFTLALWSQDDIWIILVRDNVLFSIVSSVPLVFNGVLMVDSNLNENPELGLMAISVVLQMLWISAIGPRMILNVKGYDTSVRMSQGPGTLAVMQDNVMKRNIPLSIMVHRETSITE